VAGNFDGTQTGPSGIGYRAWLTGRGFPVTAASYPIVDVVDDGLGTGDAATAGGDLTFRELGLVANPSRLHSIVDCTTDPTGDGAGGHGHINTNIVGGYDPRGDAVGIQGPFEDPEGFLRGQGINPYTRLAHTKIFRNAGAYDVSACGGTDAGLIKASQDKGAPITSNSWGAPVGGNYDDSSEAYDIGTRDGDLTEAGLQPMIHIFAAGNSGPGATTIGSPSTGKNMITVGASENDRPGPDEGGAWTDGCGIGAAGANNAMDVIGFSSRGPAEGGRAKPEVIAPGTHIQGTASTTPAYVGDSVCDQFRPPAPQNVFASSSGTSHSTPGVAGVASLMYYWLQQPPRSIAAPSSALMKAFMMANPTYLTGVSANDNLPSNSQGYGMPNMGRAFDATTQVFLHDQTQVFGATGETFTFNGAVADPAKPLRIALAWTDAPGAISDTTPQVNDLNLTATVNGVNYTGNRFTGQNSTAGGGAADTANNYEAIFLPAGTTGPIQLTVTAAGIVGDGIPGNADTTDQDFALVISNGSQTPDFFVNATPPSAQSCGVDSTAFSVEAGEVNGYDGTVTLSAPTLPVGLTAGFSSNGNPTPYTSTLTLDSTAGLASGNHVVTINGNDGTNTRSDTVTLQHSAVAAAATTLSAPANGATDVAVRPTFTWAAAADAIDYVLEVDNDPAFGSIDYTATVTGTSHQPPTGLSGATTYHWRVRAQNNCGPSANSAVFSFSTVPLFCSSPNLVIADNATATTNIVVAGGGTLTDLDVEIDALHTFIGDLTFTLRNVTTNTSVVMIDRPGRTTTGFGCGGDNPDVIVDDEGTINAETGCVAGNPGYPVGARLIPNNPLSGFDTQSFAGTWELTVQDSAGGDTGTLREWCLVPTQSAVVVNANDDSFNGTEDTLLTQAAPGVLGNDTGSGVLTATIGTGPSNGTLVGGLGSNGSFSYQPGDDYCGPDSFTYTATNGAQSDTATVSLTIACVNDAPEASNDAYSTTEDTPISVAAPGVLANDTDVETPAAALTAALVTNTTGGVTAIGTDGSVSYTPAANYCNDGTPTDDFTYEANDGALDSNAATGAVTVTCVDDDPTVETSIADQNSVEGAMVNLDISGSFDDVDGDALTFSTASTLPPGLTLSPAGVISGTIAFNGNAGSPFSITITASDGSGPTASDTFVWTVKQTNQPPQTTGLTDSQATATIPYSRDVAPAFSDGDGDALTFSAMGLPGSMSISPAGVISGTSPTSEIAVYTVTVTADDGTATVQATFQLSVLPVDMFEDGFED
jgi:subtilisin-like proprotein convertase family protein